MIKNTWTEFKYTNSSNHDSINSRKLHGPENETTQSIAWSREAAIDKLKINGISFSLFAQHYNNFADDSDIEEFFDNEILYDFKGSIYDKIEAIEYLKQFFHQRGLLYPFSSALLPAAKANQMMNTALQKKINIVTTSKGFKIQEIISI